MLKPFAGLLQAAILAGMTGFAPYVAGHCALRGAAIPGLAAHGGMAMAASARMAMESGRSGRPGQEPVARQPAPSVDGGVPAPAGRPPASHHHGHGCCGCLGPCAECGLAALPAADTAALASPATSEGLVPTFGPRPAGSGARLLPFANGPPSLLG